MIYRDMFYLYRIFPTTSSLCDFVKGSLQSNDGDPTTICRAYRARVCAEKAVRRARRTKEDGDGLHRMWPG